MFFVVALNASSVRQNAILPQEVTPRTTGKFHFIVAPQSKIQLQRLRRGARHANTHQPGLIAFGHRERGIAMIRSATDNLDRTGSAGAGAA